MPEYIVNPLPVSRKTRALLECKGVEVGGSVEWDVIGTGIDLTVEEMKALRRKHGSRNVNYKRASEVKRLMREGKKCMEIVQALHRNYKQTQVKKDHAALLGRGVAKK